MRFSFRVLIHVSVRFWFGLGLIVSVRVSGDFGGVLCLDFVWAGGFFLLSDFCIGLGLL